MKTLLLITYYELVIFTRVKVAVFFSFFFPVFIFLVFSFIWGHGNPHYSKFLLTGVIIMKVTSDAMFSIGSVIVSYLRGGFLKFLKGLPINIMTYFWALILSRVLIAIGTSVVLVLIGIFFFDIDFRAVELMYVFLGIAGAFIIFSFLGLIISVFTKNKNGDLTITNFVYFVMIFLSEIFYPLSIINPTLGKVVSFLPISPIISLTRGNGSSGTLVAMWALLIAGFFYFGFKRYKIGR